MEETGVFDPASSPVDPGVRESDWTLSAYQEREALRRLAERRAQAAAALAVLEKPDLPSSAGEEILTSDWALPAYSTRADEMRRDEPAPPAPPVSLPIMESDWTLAALKKREDKRWLAENAEARARQSLMTFESDWTLPAYQAREAARRQQESADAAANAPILVSDWILIAYRLREENRRAVERATAADAAREAAQAREAAAKAGPILLDVRPQRESEPAPRARGFSLRRLAYGLAAVLLLAGGWFLFRTWTTSPKPAKTTAKKIETPRRPLIAAPEAIKKPAPTPAEPPVAPQQPVKAQEAPPPAEPPAAPQQPVKAQEAPVPAQPPAAARTTPAPPQLPVTATPSPAVQAPAQAPQPQPQPNTNTQPPAAPATPDAPPKAAAPAPVPQHAPAATTSAPPRPKQIVQPKPKPSAPRRPNAEGGAQRQAPGLLDRLINTVKRWNSDPGALICVPARPYSRQAPR